MNYDAFLESKVCHIDSSGFEIDRAEINPACYEHQKDAIEWALRGGRRLIAMSFGLGKTAIQVEIARLVHERTGNRFLIICPLGVKHQFTEEDGPMLGVDIEYVRTDEEVLAAGPVVITNYERVRDGDISPEQFAGVSLDEGSVLRSLGSKTYQQFKELFAETPYRYVCTATPSPNRYKELIHYAEFLGIMDTGQALTRWFKRDSQKAGNLTLYQQHEREFWLWVASWALFVYKPSDLGYSDEGYELPPLQVHWHRIGVDHRRAWEQVNNWGQRRLLLDAAGGVREAAAEKRATIEARLAKMQEILTQHPGRHWLLWHHLEAERKATEKAVPKATSVYGSQPLETREERILAFSRGQIQILATKPEIAGSGCNFQRHCHSNVFLGVNYRFQDFIQAIHRTYRFQQTEPVDVHIIYAESEDAIVNTLRQKWQRHDELVARMQAIVRKYGLTQEAMQVGLQRSIGVQRLEVKGERFTAVRNDCVLELPRIGSDSVGLIHTSIPFGNQYEYVASYNDFGHNESNERFFEQMDYLIPELYRVLKPGRIAAIHCKDRIRYGHTNEAGMMYVDAFSDKVRERFERHRFYFFGRITVQTDVVRENNQTYRLGWSEQCKDGSKMGVGLPEYVLLFRKPPTDTSNAYADERVTKSKEEYTVGRWQIDAHSFWRSSGDRLLYPWEANGIYDHEAHVARFDELEAKGNLPKSFMVEAPASDSEFVWTDVVYMRTLNSRQSIKRRENHLCPLPLDIVERTIRRWSNEGEVVLDPFAGLFTVPYQAVKMGRIGYGVELSGEYVDYGASYCQEAEREATAPTLFSYLEMKQNGNGRDDQVEQVSQAREITGRKG